MQYIGNSQTKDIAYLWVKSSEVLRTKLDPQLFSAWIKPLSLTSNNTENGKNGTTRLELIAPNKFCRDHVERHYRDVISNALSDVMGSSDFSLFFKSHDGTIKHKLSPSLPTKTISTLLFFLTKVLAASIA